MPSSRTSWSRSIPDPTPVENDCSSKKKNCVANKAKALLNCYRKAATKNAEADPRCLTKASDKFTDCFAGFEAKYGGACLTSMDTATIEAKRTTSRSTWSVRYSRT